MENKETVYDVAVIGAGIVGLAIAYQAAVRGLKVVILERDSQALGATIRNFGMVWPIGQPAATVERALRAREIWLDLAKKAGFWASTAGSLHLAYHADELHVLDEFLHTTRHLPYQCQLLTPEEAVSRCPTVNPRGLEGALFSATEVNIDPREATAALHRYLREQLGVEIQYRTVITELDYPYLGNGRQRWQAERIFVCTGADFETLFPQVYAEAGLVKCKLQMLRTGPQPTGYQLGPNLAGGLTLQHYASFAHCSSLELLKRRIAREKPDYNRWGIHVMLSQTSDGALTIGDSHEYSLAPSPFDKQEINELILAYLRKMARIPKPAIAETWNGVYAKYPGHTELIVQPVKQVYIVNGLGGAGMTLSFGLAAELMDDRHSDGG